MAIAVGVANAGSFESDGSSTTLDCTVATQMDAGGFAIYTGGWFSNPSFTITVADNGPGLTWIVDKQSSGANNGTFVASAQITSALTVGTIVTATVSSAVGGRLAGLSSFTGVKTSSPVDGTPPNSLHATTAAWVTNNITIVAGSLIYGFNYAEISADGNTPTAPSVQTWTQWNGSDTHGVGEYRIESSAGTYTVGGTLGAAGGNQDSVGVAYLSAAAPVVADTTTRRYQIRRSRMTSW